MSTDSCRARVDHSRRLAAAVPSCSVVGRVEAVRGPLITASLFDAAIGDVVFVGRRERPPLAALVVGLEGTRAALSPFEGVGGVYCSAPVRPQQKTPAVASSPKLLGSVLDCFGRPLEPGCVTDAGSGSATPTGGASLRAARSISLLDRRPITEQFVSGIRVVDALLPIGWGQRLSILAPPGAGKSSLLLMLARGERPCVRVFALIGERGREVREFLDEAQRLQLRAQSVFVVSASDEAASCRIRAAETAIAIAEQLRDSGLEVVFCLDSLTRLARAYRECGLAAGEPAVRRGYPPSVFAELPRFIERAGCGPRSSITAFYTMLTGSSLEEDPIAEEARSLTDGHIVLSPQRAERSAYPAIAVSGSISRLARRFCGSPAEQRAATALRRALVRLDHDRDLAALGAEPDPELARALKHEAEIERFLCQDQVEFCDIAKTRSRLVSLGAALLGCD